MFKQKYKKNFNFISFVISITLLTLSSQALGASVLQRSFEKDNYDVTPFAGEVVSRAGTCHNGKTLIEISFQSSNDSLVKVCHDEDTDFTYWAQHYIFGAELPNSEDSGNRPSFKKAGFYADIDANNCYTQVKQIETIGMLLESEELAKHYIQPSTNLYLARGHLTPNADPIKTVEKQATFYFINASPQWQKINRGNWVALEMKLRDIAKASRSTLTVWTGSYGIMKLKNVKGRPVEIWLGRDKAGNTVKKLPVNHLTWKVIHDPATGTGVAIIQVNNPWLESISKEDDVICDDVCDQLDWVTWNTTDIVRGYTYCCTVQSFRKKVDFAPDLGNLPLMKILKM